MSSTTSCGVGTKITSGVWEAGWRCAWAGRREGAARASAAASASTIFIRGLCPTTVTRDASRLLRRNAGGEPVRGDGGVELTLVVRLGRDRRVLVEGSLDVARAVDFEARPDDQEYRRNHCNHRDDRYNRVLVVGRLRKIIVRAGDHGP